MAAMKLSAVLNWIAKTEEAETCSQIMIAAARQFDLINDQYHDELCHLNQAREETAREKRELEQLHTSFQGLIDRHGLAPLIGTDREGRPDLTKAQREKAAATRAAKVTQYRNENTYKRKNKTCCIHCDRPLTSREINVIVQMDYSVIVLRDGADFMAQACCRECRMLAADNYSKEKECLKQQLTELRIMKQMVKAINQEALRLHKEESQPAKNSDHS